MARDRSRSVKNVRKGMMVENVVSLGNWNAIESQAAGAGIGTTCDARLVLLWVIC